MLYLILGHTYGIRAASKKKKKVVEYLPKSWKLPSKAAPGFTEFYVMCEALC